MLKLKNDALRDDVIAGRRQLYIMPGPSVSA